MKTYTIQEALHLDNKMPVPAIEGKVTWVGKTIYKEGEHGKWHYQKFMLADPNAGRDDPDSAIYVTVKNKDDIEPLKGKMVRLECYEGSRGLEGLIKSVRKTDTKTYHDLAANVMPTVVEVQQAPEPEDDSNPFEEDEPKAPAKKAPVKNQDLEDFIPQTLAHVMGASLQAAITDPNTDGGMPTIEMVADYMILAYDARDLATARIRARKG